VRPGSRQRARATIDFDAQPGNQQMSIPSDNAKPFLFVPQAGSYDSSALEEEQAASVAERIVTAAAVAIAVLVVAIIALLMGMA
jgi:hypothetical protein